MAELRLHSLAMILFQAAHGTNKICIAVPTILAYMRPYDIFKDSILHVNIEMYTDVKLVCNFKHLFMHSDVLRSVASANCTLCR